MHFFAQSFRAIFVNSYKTLLKSLEQLLTIPNVSDFSVKIYNMGESCQNYSALRDFFQILD